MVRFLQLVEGSFEDGGQKIDDEYNSADNDVVGLLLVMS